MFRENVFDFTKLSVLQVVKAVKPNVLIGLSGCGGIFTDEVLTSMSEGCPVSFQI